LPRGQVQIDPVHSTRRTTTPTGHDSGRTRHPYFLGTQKRDPRPRDTGGRWGPTGLDLGGTQRFASLSLSKGRASTLMGVRRRSRTWVLPDRRAHRPPTSRKHRSRPSRPATGVGPRWRTPSPRPDNAVVTHIPTVDLRGRADPRPVPAAPTARRGHRSGGRPR